MTVIIGNAFKIFNQWQNSWFIITESYLKVNKEIIVFTDIKRRNIFLLHAVENYALLISNHFLENIINCF